MGLLIKRQVNILRMTISIQSFNLEKDRHSLQSNCRARLSVMEILYYSREHSEIICLPTGIAVTAVGLFPKQRRKVKNDRITRSIYGLVHSTGVDTAEVTTVFTDTRSKKKRGNFSGKGARTAQSFKYCRDWSCKCFRAWCFLLWIPLLKLLEALKQIKLLMP